MNLKTSILKLFTGIQSKDVRRVGDVTYISNTQEGNWFNIIMKGVGGLLLIGTTFEELVNGQFLDWSTTYRVVENILLIAMGLIGLWLIRRWGFEYKMFKKRFNKKK